MEKVSCRRNLKRVEHIDRRKKFVDILRHYYYSYFVVLVSIVVVELVVVTVVVELVVTDVDDKVNEYSLNMKLVKLGVVASSLSSLLIS